MKDEFTSTIIMAIAVLLVTHVAVKLCEKADACYHRGGTLVRTVFWVTCISEGEKLGNTTGDTR